METGTGGRDRAQSEPVAFALLVGLTAVGATVTLAVGGVAITDIGESARGSQAESSMTQFDATASRVALGESVVREVNFGDSGEGSVEVNDSAGRIKVVVENSTSSQVVVNKSLGAVVYDVGGGSVAYQGGGVWRAGTNGSKMVSAPEYHYRGKTLTLPIVRVTGGSVSEQSGESLTVRGNGTETLYPNGSFTNPLTNGSVIVTVTSDYHEGWSAYFKDRTEGNVSHFRDNRTVRVNLTVPYRVTFEAAVSATSADSDAISTSGSAQIDAPQDTGSQHPSADSRIEDRIDDCESGGCADLSSELGDDTLEDGTYYHDGDITIDATTYETNGDSIAVVVNGDLEFDGGGGPGTPDHVVNGAGEVTFYVKGNVEIKGSSAVNTGGDPEDVLVYVHTSAGSVTAASGTPQFTGYIYAPGTELAINGGGSCGASGPPSIAGPDRVFDAVSDSGIEAVAAATMAASCDGNIVGGVVVEKASASGNGKLTYREPMDLEFEVASGAQLTYLHVTENRIDVED